MKVQIYYAGLTFLNNVFFSQGFLTFEAFKGLCGQALPSVLDVFFFEDIRGLILLSALKKNQQNVIGKCFGTFQPKALSKQNILKISD